MPTQKPIEREIAQDEFLSIVSKQLYPYKGARKDQYDWFTLISGSSSILDEAQKEEK